MLNPGRIAIFLITSLTAGSSRFQNQGIAYSLDRGRSWAKYKGNPVSGLIPAW